MPLTRAEIQKAYRERKKKNEGEKYLQKERRRRMTYYKPASELSKQEKKKLNKKNRERVKKHRQRKREEAVRRSLEANVDPVPSSSGYESNVLSPPEGPMIVRMDFNSGNRRPGTRKRISRAVAKANREIQHLKHKNEEMKKKIKTLQKRNQRRMNKNLESPKTPRSRTDQDLKEAGLTPTRGKKVRKQLLMGNALVSEIKQARVKARSSRARTKVLESIASGNILQKYRGLKWLSKNTGLNRNKLGNVVKKWVEIGQQSRKRIQQKYRKEVNAFLERDDNSRAQPGKADVKKDSSGVKMQTRVLTDYLSNLYDKFTSEFPNVKLSFATFCRMRPKHILTTSLITRSSCLCTRHQNMALLLKSLRREGISAPINPESFLKTEKPTDDELGEKLSEKVTYSQWKRVEVNDKGKTKSVMRIVDVELEKTAFISMFDNQLKEFEEHVYRVRKQYEEIRKLKENLPDHHLILQMDFAENFSCKSNEEIQSAYWNQTGVTLHPIVAYFMQMENGEKKLNHKSFVVVSDEMSHSATTVHGFVNKIIPYLKEIDPAAEMVHYWTDGPTSQYRNKQIFYTVANHKDIYGMSARWNYFEVGHGKGPCDGLGGTTKRMADEAIRSGRAIIQDPSDFYKWAVNSSMKGVKFLFVSSDECSRAGIVLGARQVIPLKGTFKLHVVVGLGNSEVAFKDVSCYCSVCVSGTNVCSSDGWKTQSMIGSVLKKSADKRKGANQAADSANLPVNVPTTSADVMSMATDNPVDPSGNPADPTGNPVDPAGNPADHAGNPADNPVCSPVVTTCMSPVLKQVNIHDGDYVAAIYGNEWCVGQVVQVDDDDKEVEVKFMEKKKQLYRWPVRDDIIWISQNSIICKIKEPIPTAKSKRMVKLDADDINKIKDMFGKV